MRALWHSILLPITALRPVILACLVHSISLGLCQPLLTWFTRQGLSCGIFIESFYDRLVDMKLWFAVTGPSKLQRKGSASTLSRRRLNKEIVFATTAIAMH